MSPTTTRSRPAPGGAPPPPTPIDPRISARRTEVTRQQGRRRLRLVGILLAVAAVAFGVWSILHSSLFSARVVTVVGAFHESAAQIEAAAAGLAHHPALLDINSGAAALDVERLPWVRAASISVHWPDGVRVTVAERVPRLLMAGHGGEWAVMSGTGRVLGEVKARPLDLRQISGPQPPGLPGSTLGAADQLGVLVASTLPVSFRDQVTSVNVEAGGWVQLTMTTPILVDLGNSSQLGAKYEDVSALLAGATLHNGDILDVSVPKAPTVTGP